MSEAEWLVRAGRPTDQDLVAKFSCADPGVSWQVEVERFVQTQLIDWVFDPKAADDDPRLLLAIIAATGELFGVAAHERATLQGSGGPMFDVTKIQVVALAKPWQGRHFGSGVRASDVLMSAVMTDIAQRDPRRNAHIFAIVHAQNHRSLVVCQRHGLTEELSPTHPDYRWLITP